MKKFVLVYFLALIYNFSFSQEKIKLDHSVYECWKDINHPLISSDGKYVAYEINPQKGDGFLVLRDLEKGKNDTIPRGNRAVFSFDSKYLAGMIKVPEDSSKLEKKEKKKPGELYRDSLFVLDLKSGNLEKFPDVRSFKMSEEGMNTLVFHLDYISPGKNSENDDQKGEGDSGNIDLSKKFSSIAKKYKLANLIVYDPSSGESQQYENVSSYTLSKNGELVGFHQLARDTVTFSVVYELDKRDDNLNICFEKQGMVYGLTADDGGRKMAFMFSADSARKAGMNLHLWETGNNSSSVVIDTLGIGMEGEKLVNRNGKLYFSSNSDRLFFGTTAPEEDEREDTLLKDEKVSLDVWSWQDDLLQPMQLKQLKDEKNKTNLACYVIPEGRAVQLADEEVERIKTMHEGNGDVMLGFAGDKYGKYLSWEGLRYKDVYYVDPSTGSKRLLVRKLPSDGILSPFGKYLLYYSMPDSTWYSLEISSGKVKDLTGSIPFNFYNERNDIPMLPRSYGIAGFTKNDDYVLIYDRYDIWKIDPSGERKGINLTAGKGRNQKIYFRYNKLDKDEYYIDLQKPMILSAFNEENQDDGYFRYYRDKLEKLISSPHSYSQIHKASDKEVYIFRKGDFMHFNDLYVARSNMNSPEKISDANPQSKKYLWGNVEKVGWLSFNGDRLKGLLYTPENLDKSEKYPMLVYFYELYSDRIHSHRIPSPSRSIINPAWCTSNGYVVFIPDIVYRVGYPGQSAYDAVVSGTQVMLERYSYIDAERMGLQGQSWGGYQVAWLVTQTNLFAAAMAGAPVSNMTSAYGGIRWGTGMSRMFQYEKTQSRIGGTLWDMQSLYLENSPLFHAPRIETPLLIMHNDRDGAVPWYQGIELFVAMRRLGKPAWMLTYNNEEHNLTRWPNRIDLDIRMMQFFDHYLKGKEMPAWMSEGVPAVEKNRVTGRQLLED